MTDLERKEQLIFSSENINNNVAVFGSRATTGTMTFSNDPNIIQGVDNNGTNWNNGWSSAVLNGNSPLMEDFNAISYVNSYNLAYLLQKGIAEWSENTTYFKGNICMVINDQYEPNLYYSYIDNNLNNNPKEDTDGESWRQLKMEGGGGNLPATLITSTVPINDSNYHLADGSELSYNGIYKDFYDYMLNIYNNESLQASVFCTLEEYNQDITTYGICGKYVLVENQYIKLPTINGWIEGLNSATTNGTVNPAGLPNITGTFYTGRSNDSGWNGAFNKDELMGYYSNSASASDGGKYSFDASRSNSIYGNSNEVRPRGVQYLVYIVLGTKTNTEVEIDINKVVNDITALSTEVLDIKNNPYLVEAYQNPDNTDYYRKYSDGWVEQGGIISNIPNNTAYTLNFFVPFKSIRYVLTTSSVTDAYTNFITVMRIDNSVVNILNRRTTGSGTIGIACMWQACGYYK